jgi:DNA-binding transcriptional regulator YiaG
MKPTLKSPMTGNDMVLCREKRTIPFRKEEFEIMYHFYKDTDGEQYTEEFTDEVNINQVYNKYRDKYNLPFPDEIKAIRAKYDLSAIKMSEVLGFGANVWRNYEAGEVPSESNARLVQVADDAAEFGKMVRLTPHLDEKTKEKILLRVDELLKANDGWHPAYSEEDYVMGTDPGEALPDNTTGYRKPSLERLTEMIVFFTEQMQPFKTKMNKLLFYADFRHYQLYGVSISGARYRAVTWGPVPKQFDALFDHVSRKEEVEFVQHELPDGNLAGQFKPKEPRSFREILFAETELAVLREVAQRFAKDDAKRIIATSHEEEAWIKHEADHSIIDYNLAFGLKAFDEAPRS